MQQWGGNTNPMSRSAPSLHSPLVPQTSANTTIPQPLSSNNRSSSFVTLAPASALFSQPQAPSGLHSPLMARGTYPTPPSSMGASSPPISAPISQDGSHFVSPTGSYIAPQQNHPMSGFTPPYGQVIQNPMHQVMVPQGMPLGYTPPSSAGFATPPVSFQQLPTDTGHFAQHPYGQQHQQTLQLQQQQQQAYAQQQQQQQVYAQQQAYAQQQQAYVQQQQQQSQQHQQAQQQPYGSSGHVQQTQLGQQLGYQAQQPIANSMDATRMQHNDVQEQALQLHKLRVQQLQEEQQRAFREEQERERVEQEKRRQEWEKAQEEERRLHQEELLRREEARRVQEEAKRQEELRRQHEEAIRVEELRRQEEMRRQEELRRVEELRRQEEIRQEELRRQQMEEARRLEEWKKMQEEIRKQEELRRQEELRLAEIRRQQEALRIQQELQRQEELRRQQEEARKQEEWRKQQEELQRQEELRKQREEMLWQEELRRQEELRKQQEELQRQEELRLKQEEAYRQEQLRRQELVRKQQEELVRLENAIRKQQEDIRRQQELAWQEEMRKQQELKLEELRRMEEQKRQEEARMLEAQRIQEEYQKQQEALRVQQQLQYAEEMRRQEVLRQQFFAEQLRRKEEHDELIRREEALRQEQLRQEQERQRIYVQIQAEQERVRQEQIRLEQEKTLHESALVEHERQLFMQLERDRADMRRELDAERKRIEQERREIEQQAATGSYMVRQNSVGGSESGSSRPRARSRSQKRSSEMNEIDPSDSAPAHRLGRTGSGDSSLPLKPRSARGSPATVPRQASTIGMGSPVVPPLASESFLSASSTVNTGLISPRSVTCPVCCTALESVHALDAHVQALHPLEADVAAGTGTIGRSSRWGRKKEKKPKDDSRSSKKSKKKDNDRAKEYAKKGHSLTANAWPKQMLRHKTGPDHQGKRQNSRRRSWGDLIEAVPDPAKAQSEEPTQHHTSPSIAAAICTLRGQQELPRTAEQLSPQPTSPANRRDTNPPPVPERKMTGSRPSKQLPAPPRLQPPPRLFTPDMAAIAIQRVWRGYKIRREVEQHQLQARVAREILTSEQIYVNNLRNISEIFIQPLRKACESGKGIISVEDIKRIFSNLEEIYQYNVVFLAQLEQAITNWHVESLIAHLFLSLKSDFVELYSTYANLYDEALQTVIRCRNIKAFDAFLRRCQQHPECGGLHLEAFMILPIQRVPRYVILLRDLLRRTNNVHPDYSARVAAADFMDGICKAVNENKRTAENLKKQLDSLSVLQAKLRPKEMVKDLVTESRILLYQGPILYYDQHSDKKKEVELLVFNDLLLLTKAMKKDLCKVMARLNYGVDSIRLEIMNDSSDFMGLDMKNAFVLHTPRISYLLFCTTPEDRAAITQHLKSSCMNLAT